MRTGTTVLYVLNASDVLLINQRRTTGDSIQQRLQQNPPQWPAGAVAHVGEPVQVGDSLPMLVTRESAQGSLVSGQVFLNGNDTYWVAAAEFVVDEPPKPGQACDLNDAATWQLREPSEPKAGKRAAARSAS